MKKLIIIPLLIVAIGAFGQTSVPIKEGKLFNKIFHKGTATIADLAIRPTIGSDLTYVLVRKYRGKWYSNYPYTIKADDNTYKVYKDGRVVMLIKRKKIETINPKSI